MNVALFLSFFTHSISNNSRYYRRVAWKTGQLTDKPSALYCKNCNRDGFFSIAFQCNSNNIHIIVGYTRKAARHSCVARKRRQTMSCSWKQRIVKSYVQYKRQTITIIYLQFIYYYQKNRHSAVTMSITKYNLTKSPELRPSSNTLGTRTQYNLPVLGYRQTLSDVRLWSDV